MKAKSLHNTRVQLGPRHPAAASWHTCGHGLGGRRARRPGASPHQPGDDRGQPERRSPEGWEQRLSPTPGPSEKAQAEEPTAGVDAAGRPLPQPHSPAGPSPLPSAMPTGPDLASLGCPTRRGGRGRQKRKGGWNSRPHGAGRKAGLSWGQCPRLRPLPPATPLGTALERTPWASRGSEEGPARPPWLPAAASPSPRGRSPCEPSHPPPEQRAGAQHRPPRAQANEDFPAVLAHIATTCLNETGEGASPFLATALVPQT